MRHKNNFLSIDVNDERQGVETDDHFRADRGHSFDIKLDCQHRETGMKSSLLGTP